MSFREDKYMRSESCRCASALLARTSTSSRAMSTGVTPSDYVTMHHDCIAFQGLSWQDLPGAQIATGSDHDDASLSGHC
jgi:hypothetical protein